MSTEWASRMSIMSRRTMMDRRDTAHSADLRLISVMVLM